MKKILCPTDFSETAQNAIAYAAKLTQALHGELILLNVQSLFDVTPIELIQGKSKSVLSAAAWLEEESQQISRMFKISCTATVEPSVRRLSTIIHDKAIPCDLIVMGTDGPDDLYKFFGGSNTYNAIERSETPVLMIPAGYVYCEIKSIVYAFDYLQEHDLALARVIPLVKALPCDLTILQVLEEAYSRVVENDLKDLQSIIRHHYGDDLKFNFDTLRSKDIAASINSYVLQNKPDALALCTVHRNLLQRLFHKSVIKSLTAYASYPVFVFHR